MCRQRSSSRSVRTAVRGGPWPVRRTLLVWPSWPCRPDRCRMGPVRRTRLVWKAGPLRNGRLRPVGRTGLIVRPVGPFERARELRRGVSPCGRSAYGRPSFPARLVIVRFAIPHEPGGGRLGRPFVPFRNFVARPFAKVGTFPVVAGPLTMSCSMVRKRHERQQCGNLNHSDCRKGGSDDWSLFRQELAGFIQVLTLSRRQTQTHIAGVGSSLQCAACRDQLILELLGRLSVYGPIHDIWAAYSTLAKILEYSRFDIF